MLVKTLLSDCIQNTSAHGPPQLINKKNNLCIKLLWALILLGSCGVFFLHSSSLVLKYVKHETTVSVNFDGIDFIVPDIYICNEHAPSKVMMNHHAETEDFDYYNITALINGSRFLLNDALAEHRMEGFTTEFVDRVFFDRNYSDFITGYIETTLSHLSFNELFHRVPHHEYHACYKLNENYKKYIFRSDSLSFILYTDVHWFNRAASSNTSISDKHHATHPLRNYPYNSAVTHTIFVTPPGEYPHKDDVQLHANRGRSSLMEITMEYYQREQRKTFPCLRETEYVTYYNHLNNSNPLTYTLTQRDCMYRIFQEKLIKRYECVTTRVPLTQELWLNKSIKRCPGYLINNDYYLGNAINKVSLKDADYDHCRTESLCNLPVYKSDTQTLPILENQLEDLINAAYNSNKWLYKNLYNHFHSRESMSWEDRMWLETSILDSFMFISFTAPHTQSTVYKESFAYELKSLLSDIGGILGFYMGISLVTLSEILGFGVKHVSNRFEN